MHLWNAELSLCRESERGHTPQNTHTHLKCPSLSSCVLLFALKEVTHTHTPPFCLLLASHQDLTVCLLLLALICGPAVVPGHCRFRGVEMGMCWGLGVDGADRPSSRHSTSFVIFISRVFFFFGVCYTKIAPKPLPSPPNRGSLKLVTQALFTHNKYSVGTLCNSCMIL